MQEERGHEDAAVAAAAAAEEAFLRELLKADPAAVLQPQEGPPRHCTNSYCLCGKQVLFAGHAIQCGHIRLDSSLDVVTAVSKLASTPCLCCKEARAAARRARRKGPQGERRCNYCGSTHHLQKDCTFGSDSSRAQQFLTCSPECFVRRFVLPLHRARSDFGLEDLTKGRVDVAARVTSACLVSSQRLRHNSEIWLSFLGDEVPTSLTVTGGLVRGLKPNEASIAGRMRQAIDAMLLLSTKDSSLEGKSSLEDKDDGLESVEPHLSDYDVRGFRYSRGGFDDALSQALTLAREDGTRAPVLLLMQGAPPLQQVLEEYHATSPPLRDVVVVLGDDIGMSEEEVSMVKRSGEEVAGGGRVLCASLGSGALLASHCIVILHHYFDQIHDCPSQLWRPQLEVRRSAHQRQRRRKAQQRRKAGGDEEDACDGKRGSSGSETA